MISARTLTRPPGTMHAPRTLALFLLSLPAGVIKIAIHDHSVERDDWQYTETRHTRGNCQVRGFILLANVGLVPIRSLTLAFILVPRAVLHSLGFLFGR